MTTRPPGETDDGAKARHLAWLNNQAALRPPRIRETCQKHGRGYWQGTYGDDPAFTYIPLGCANPAAKRLGRRAGLMWSARIGRWSPETAAAAWVVPFTAR